jgi:hypothetical protein
MKLLPAANAGISGLDLGTPSKTRLQNQAWVAYERREGSVSGRARSGGLEAVGLNAFGMA